MPFTRQIYGFGIYNLIAVVKGMARGFFLPCGRGVSLWNGCNPALAVSGVLVAKDTAPKMRLEVSSGSRCRWAGIFLSWTGMFGLQCPLGINLSSVTVVVESGKGDPEAELMRRGGSSTP